MSGVDDGRDTIWLDAFHPDTVRSYARNLERRAQTAKLLLTGIEEWDKACDDTGGGLDDYWYLVVGGASNVGKTQLMIALALKAISQGFAVCLMSLEEPADQILRRLYAATSPLGYYDFTYSRFDDHRCRQLIELTPYAGKVAINDEIENEELPSIIRYLDAIRDAMLGQPMVVLFDHLQLVKGDTAHIAAAATAVSEGLRKWAKRNRTLTIAFSQLVTDTLRSASVPRFHDLWGGTSMYSNPSQVIMLDHTSVRVDEHMPHLKRMWMLVDKNRYGPQLVAIPIEANLKTCEWRGALPDELHGWAENPWIRKPRRSAV